ncbi:MAG: hypothetical protein KIT31_43495, partial [Deltaproteobacteria bacterium]|nr:hypothetical protein [Deltaproteobacteria bacterium]
GGLDELAVRGPSHVAIFDGGRVTTHALSPGSFRVRELDPAGLAGGDATFNAAAIADVLGGRDVGEGERLEAFLLAAGMTAALALELLQPTLDLDRLPDQLMRARAVATDGKALAVLDRWREAMR